MRAVHIRAGRYGQEAARCIVVLSIFCLLLSISATSSHADRRVALVIGNGGYQHASPLKNPTNDATDLGVALKKLGFEVSVGLDLDRARMHETLQGFARQINGAELALFFYAGHALQVSGTNYLLPADARLQTEGDIEFETISLNVVLRHMERQALNSLILLDACRNNPFAERLRSSSRSITVGQGLADAAGKGIDILIGFSTNPGAVADDGQGRNSPYAAALLRHIERPGEEVISTLRRVRNDVYAATAGRQAPWDHTSLRHAVFFIPPRRKASAAPLRPRVVSYRQSWPDGRFTLGSFKRIDSERWSELVQTSNERRATTFDFRQLSNSPTAIVLHDPERTTGPIWVQIDLQQKRIFWSDDAQRTWKYLYDVTAVD